ncbi:MAG: helix-turn-helix domain-containing protein [Lachnospiraceae bacterium]|nr:helix-turn-helix domain-containing protein [Lachnospiraceae bacterium]
MQENFKVSRVKRDAAFEMQNEHYHSFYEFYYLVSGDRKFFLNGKTYRVKSGDIMLIPKREIHRTTFYGEGSEHERIAMCFSEDIVRYLKECIGQEHFEECFYQRHLTVPVEQREYLESLFDKMITEYEGKDEYSDFLCRRYCEEVILFIIRCQKEKKAKSLQESETVEIQHLSAEDMELEKAAQYVNEHFMETLTLPIMAERSCMSDSYFSRRFKQVTGFGFKEYLNMVRIRHACELLVSTDLSITKISEACGYMDSNYFGDAFKKLKHVAPREYRKNKVMV